MPLFMEYENRASNHVRILILTRSMKIVVIENVIQLRFKITIKIVDIMILVIPFSEGKSLVC